jgi:hypothetical protein
MPPIEAALAPGLAESCELRRCRETMGGPLKANGDRPAGSWRPVERNGDRSAGQWRPVERNGDRSAGQWRPVERNGDRSAGQWRPVERNGDRSSPIATGRWGQIAQQVTKF